MLKLQLVFKVLVSVVSGLSFQCVPDLSFISNIMSDISVEVNIKEVINETKSNYKDDKLTYIYKYRKVFQVCGESRFILGFSEKYSKVYQINDQKYIVELACSLGAYSATYDYLLYSFTDYGVVIKRLQFLVATNELSYDDLNFKKQPVWFSTNGVSGLPKFDFQSQVLKVRSIHLGEGYEAEYIFNDDEFKLTKYSRRSLYKDSDIYP
jgi:hypothetical protein